MTRKGTKKKKGEALPRPSNPYLRSVVEHLDAMKEAIVKQYTPEDELTREDEIDLMALDVALMDLMFGLVPADDEE